MGDAGRPIDQVANGEAIKRERVSDESTVAAPPAGFGAHDREGLSGARARFEGRQAGPECLGMEIRRVRDEAV